MTARIFDSGILESLFSSAEMKAGIFGSELRQEWLDAKCALAQAKPKLGVIPTAVAREVICLQRKGIGELVEPHNAGEGGCSTMPLKRYPIVCEAIAGPSRHERPDIFALWERDKTIRLEIC